jgi:hypothetical protein
MAMGFVTRVIKALLLSICALILLTVGINIVWSMRNPPATTSSIASIARVDPLEARFQGQAIEITIRNRATGRVCGVVKSTRQRFISGDPILISGSYSSARPIAKASYYSAQNAFKEEWIKYCEGTTNPDRPIDARAQSQIDEAVKVIRWRFVDFKLMSAQSINGMVCGVVKTRNSHGGYTEQRFVGGFSEKQPVIFEDEYKREGRIYGAEQFAINAFNAEWNKHCSQKSARTP